jgi:broad specificity phosphatase PhoE
MFILIRHGESVANVANDNSDGKDTDLTPLGLQQSAKLKSILAKYFAIDFVFSSPALRCIKTAAACTDVPAAVLDDIYELSNGVIDGVKTEDIAKIPTVGKKLAKIMEMDKDITKLDMIFNKRTIANLKRFEQLCKAEGEYPARLARAVRLAKSYTDRGKNVLFVTHAGVASAIVCHMFDMHRLANVSVPNCSISVIDMKKKQLLLNRYDAVKAAKK